MKINPHLTRKKPESPLRHRPVSIPNDALFRHAFGVFGGRMKKHKVVAPAGMYIHEAALRCIESATFHNARTSCEFNGTVMYADPGETSPIIQDRWYRERGTRLAEEAAQVKSDSERIALLESSVAFLQTQVEDIVKVLNQPAPITWGVSS